MHGYFYWKERVRQRTLDQRERNSKRRLLLYNIIAPTSLSEGEGFHTRPRPFLWSLERFGSVPSPSPSPSFVTPWRC
uniref:Uncharacterized protein n=2 Tax=Picea TaxID=3328 RepID=A0A101LXC6_PICGL|nr:hypothetical protein ABT39_MTgene6103 [Picea glauca]QHR92603.1 hypothetical protein Q903MT_gene6650 [Picea sitchensis]